MIRATAESVNTYFAQLMVRVGTPAAISVARRMGITSPLHDYCSLVLGTENLTPLELAGAYATLTAGGRPLAGKTGTTSSFADAWFTGFTPQLATSVWVGDPRAQVPMRHLFDGGPVYGGTFPPSLPRLHRRRPARPARRGAMIPPRRQSAGPGQLMERSGAPRSRAAADPRARDPRPCRAQLGCFAVGWRGW